QPLKLVVFDRHNDLLPAPAGHVSCGSWLKEVLELPAVKGVLLIGPDPLETLPGKESLPGTESLSGKVTWAPLKSARRELVGFCTSVSRVYVSIDKDVLADVDTDWGAGTVRLGAMLDLLARACRHAKLVGADVCGELAPRTPWPSAAELAQIRQNEDINLAICQVLSVRLGMRQVRLRGSRVQVSEQARLRPRPARLTGEQVQLSVSQARFSGRPARHASPRAERVGPQAQCPHPAMCGGA
ncbi:MAG: hypothetical protein H5T84_04995, partial [Thermoleophilia bacterium]|nr:hypothetical protein [Thermoleophilia bacterium]